MAGMRDHAGRSSEHANTPEVGRPRGSVWRPLYAEGITWEGQVFIAGAEHDLAARLIVTKSRLALISGGDIALELPRRWLRPEPRRRGADSIVLSITPEGAIPGSDATDRLELIVRKGSTEADALVADLTRHAKKSAPKAIAEAPVWDTRVGASLAMALPPLPEFDESPETPKRQWPPVTSEAVAPAPPKRAPQPEAESIAAWTARNLDRRPAPEPEPVPADISRQARRMGTLSDGTTVSDLDIPYVQPQPNRRVPAVVRTLQVAILLVLIGTGWYFAGDRIAADFSFAALNDRVRELTDNETPENEGQTGKQVDAPVVTPTVTATSAQGDGTSGAGKDDTALHETTVEPTVGGIGGATEELPETYGDPTDEPVEEVVPTDEPAEEVVPTDEPVEEIAPTDEPTDEPAPTEDPTDEPAPTDEPTEEPTAEPTQEPTNEPTAEPTEEPTQEPTEEPTQEPTATIEPSPTSEPTQEPTAEPTDEPSPTATEEPTTEPSPTVTVTDEPTTEPSPSATVTTEATVTPTEPPLEPQEPSVTEGEVPAQQTVSGPFRYEIEGAVSGGDITADLPEVQAVTYGEWIVLSVYAENTSGTEQVFDMSQFSLVADGQEVLLDTGTSWVASMLGYTPAYGNTEAILWAPGEGHRIALTFLAPVDASSLILNMGDQQIDLSASLEAGQPLSAPDAPASEIAPYEATVVEVVDAETIVIEKDGVRQTVKYLGIDAPTGEDCYAAEATEANRALVEGQTVRLERQATNTDAKGNWVRDVWVVNEDGSATLVSQALVRDGAVQSGISEPNTRFASWLTASEATAQAEGAGLWDSCASGEETGATATTASTLTADRRDTAW